MKKSNKKFLNIFLIGLLVLGIITVYYFSTRQSFVYTNLPPTVNKLDSWQGRTISINSLFLGSASADGTSLKNYDSSVSSLKHVNICSGGKTGATLSNSYSSSTELKLSSSFGGSATDCSGNNYINSNFTLSSGKLTLNYVLHTSAKYKEMGSSVATVKLNGKTFQLICEDARSDGGRYPDGKPKNACTIYGGSSGNPVSKSGSYILTLNKSTPIKIEVTTQRSYHGSASASATLTFVPSTQTYYELMNNQCNQISILPSEKTSNDYSTLSECKTHISEENQTNQTNNQTNNQPNNQTNGTTQPSTVSQTNYIPFYILIGIILLIILFLFIKKKKRSPRK